MAKTYRMILVAMFFVGTSAYASILVEPYLGYYAGKISQSGGDSYNTSGVGYGARLGFKSFTGLLLGVDYLTGKGKDSATPSNDLTPSMLGAFVGYEFPVLLRAYAGYVFSNKMDSASGGTTTTYDGGSAIKLGVGFTALPLVSINLEYISGNYKKFGSSTLTPQVDQSMYGLNISAPFSF